MTAPPAVAVLGASGLIGCAIAEDLRAHGWPLLAVARRLTTAQRAAFGAAAREAPFAGLDAGALAELLAGADVVVNCVGVLQDGPRGRTADVHERFVATLVEAMRRAGRPQLLVHLSVPGEAADDETAFSRTKRHAEALIAASGLPHAILRPGFVIAPTAYGGGALVRALAALPVRLDPATSARPFAATALSDLCGTVRRAVELWPAGAVWDVMERTPGTVGDVVEAFRARFGGPRPVAALPGWLLSLGALAGDAAAWLGWSPPVRSTALKELRRGVTGDPSAWSAATGIEPADCAAALRQVAASAQEAWFARLFLAKPLVLGVLSAFWIVSGAVALGPGYAAARAALVAVGFPSVAAGGATIATSLADIAVGLAIAARRTCRGGLVAGLALTLAYLAAATVLAPGLWADPLGPLVKDAPALVLMLAGLAILRDR